MGHFENLNFWTKTWIFEFSVIFPMLSYIWIVRSIFAHMLSYIWIVRSIFAPMLMSRGVAGGRRGSADGDGDGGEGNGGGDGVPTTLPSGQTPGPSRPGTKYPVRGQSLTSITQLDLGQNTILCSIRHPQYVYISFWTQKSTRS